MKWRMDTMRSIIVLVFVLSVLAPGQSLAAEAVQDSSAAQAVQDSSAVSQEKPFFLPFMGEKARERGYKLPRALGAGINFIFLNRPTEVTGVEAGFNNTGLNPLSGISFPSAVASVRTVMARVDAWLLPFLNIYGLGGYIWNTTQLSVDVDLPSGRSTEIQTTGDLEGPTYGGGVTLAGGYKWLFASVDFNGTYSNLNELSTFVAKLSSVRLGWNGKLEGKTPARFYTGAEYWDTKRTIAGSLTVDDGLVQTVEYSVDQQPADPWTVIVGTSVTVTDAFWIVLEYQGWRDTQVLIAQATFRFPK
jgi:hypothetical protein